MSVTVRMRLHAGRAIDGALEFLKKVHPEDVTPAEWGKLHELSATMKSLLTAARAVHERKVAVDDAARAKAKRQKGLFALRSVANGAQWEKVVKLLDEGDYTDQERDFVLNNGNHPYRPLEEIGR